jgi:arsenical pump membrane protein
MTNTYIWLISFVAIAGVIIRPFKTPEVLWALAGAVMLLLFGLIAPRDAAAGVGKGLDVYLFLTGMMLLAETAREEKLFDWLAAHATRKAKGSPKRLFFLIYLVGVVVTTFLSNDATAVVLTPAVAAAIKAAKVDKPLPYLFICAFIANAASFVLPISNPANLVIYGKHMPSLLAWMSHYLIPSIVSIVITYVILFATQRKDIEGSVATDVTIPQLSAGGKTALVGIGFTAIVLLISSALDIELGLPTAITGILTSIIVIVIAHKNPVTIVKGVSWAVLPLVAGLFVIVEALNHTGITQKLAQLLQHHAAQDSTTTAWGSGIITAFACNLMNNLPAGLIAGNVVQGGHVPELVKSATLIGIDLGPNLSMTGSLATILWLVALRREGQEVTAWQFLKTGAVVMTVTLLFVLASLWIG